MTEKTDTVRAENTDTVRTENTDTVRAENTDIIRNIRKKIPAHIRLCFAAGMISGILIHAYMLTNKLPNWDDINNVGGYAVGSEFGRWFLKYVNPLDGIWSVPWLSGLFAIVMISAAACMVMQALELRSATSAVLIPLMMLSFPSMCSLFTFMFTADCYAVAIFFACTAVWLIRRVKSGWIPGILLLVLSMGLYQAYLCLALGLLVTGLFLDLAKQREPGKIFCKGFLTLLILLASVGIYTVVSRLIFPQLDSYNGLSQMGKIDLARLPRLILRAYRWVAEYFILEPYSYVNTFTWFLNVLACLLAAALVIYGLIRSQLWKKPAEAALYLFLAAAVVLSLGSIIIMAPDASVSLLMLYQYHLLYVFLIVMLERGLLGEDAIWPLRPCALPARITGAAVVLLVALIGYQNFVITNQAYFRMDIAYQRAYAYYNRIMARIESTEGYSHGDPFALIGEYGLTDTPDLLGDYAMDGDLLDDLSGVAKEDGLLTSGVRHNFMKTYIGVAMPDISPETEEAIRATEEYQSMPSYPEEGCVRQINGVWVVKACEEIYG